MIHYINPRRKEALQKFFPFLIMYFVLSFGLVINIIFFLMQLPVIVQLRDVYKSGIESWRACGYSKVVYVIFHIIIFIASILVNMQIVNLLKDCSF